jgi:phosphatidylserine/phosphatidylglycerophosphate/cardiolipin synthase-like enzyme
MSPWWPAVLVLAQEALVGAEAVDRLVRRVGEAKATVQAAVYEVSVFDGRDSDNGVARLFGALRAAVERGVTVELVFDHLSEEGAGDPVERMRARYFAGVPARAAERVRLRRFGGGERTLHAKAVIVDGRHVLLGSHNWTQRAFGTTRAPGNVEVSVAIDSAELAASLLEKLRREGVFR